MANLRIKRKMDLKSKGHIWSAWLLVSLIFWISACSSPAPERQASKRRVLDSLLASVEVRTPPFADSTSFDHFPEMELTEIHSHMLGIPEIFSGRHFERSMIIYQANLGNTFKTVAIGIMPSENELESWLVTYSTQFEYIDKVMVAADEVAESWFSSRSTVEGNQILRSDFNFSDGAENQVVVHRYKAGLTGKFRELESRD